MHKQSIFAILHTSLQSSSLHDQPSQTFELLHATLEQNDCKSSAFPVTVTLREHQGHSNWNQTVQFSSAQQHSEFETNRITSVPTHDHIKRIFHKITSAEFSPLNRTCAN